MTASEALGVVEVLAGEWEAGELARQAAAWSGPDGDAQVSPPGGGEWVRSAVDDATQLRVNAVVASVMG